jgi:hypothetical protein
MKRLIELAETDRLTARANALVRALGPTVESAERLQRVRRSLDAPPRVASLRWAWRGALAVGLLGASAAAAGSVALSGVLGQPLAAPSTSAQLAPPVRSKPAAPAPAPRQTAAGAEPMMRQPDRPIAESAARSSSPTLHFAAPALSDVARVHEAAKALRRDADPARALQLLERPGTHITGPLAEEALALRIEASAARGDGRAAKLAAAYLAQYPAGRYRQLAAKALAPKR